jgi:hypothetical protein
MSTCSSHCTLKWSIILASWSKCSLEDSATKTNRFLNSEQHLDTMLPIWWIELIIWNIPLKFCLDSFSFLVIIRLTHRIRDHCIYACNTGLVTVILSAWPWQGVSSARLHACHLFWLIIMESLVKLIVHVVINCIIGSGWSALDNVENPSV